MPMPKKESGDCGCSADAGDRKPRCSTNVRYEFQTLKLGRFQYAELPASPGEGEAGRTESGETVRVEVTITSSWCLVF